MSLLFEGAAAGSFIAREDLEKIDSRACTDVLIVFRRNLCYHSMYAGPHMRAAWRVVRALILGEAYSLEDAISRIGLDADMKESLWKSDALDQFRKLSLQDAL